MSSSKETAGSLPEQPSEEDSSAKPIIIDKELNLSEEEKARLIFHSFANVLNVLIGLLAYPP